MVGGTVALAGIWFVRDAIQAGNPLYPEPVRIAGRTFLRGGVGPPTAWSSSVLKDIATGNGSGLKIWAETFAVWIGPAIVVCAGAALCLLRWKRGNLRGWLAAIAGIWFLIYAATPYTGPSSFPLLIVSQVRYGLTAMTLAAVCACIESGWFRAVAGIAIGYDIWGVLHGVHLSSVPAAGIQTPSARVIVVALVGSAVAVFFLGRWRSGESWRRLANMPKVAAGSGVLALALVSAAALSVEAVRHAPSPSRLDRALMSAGRPQGPVMIDGDGDVLGAMGNRLQHYVVSAGGSGAPHQAPLSTPALLDARVRSVDPAAVIVGPANWPGVIPGWTPPGYSLLYSESGRRIYVKDGVLMGLRRSDR
jgi:hypothetical protein